MRMIKCDRCGKVSDELYYSNYRLDVKYSGRVGKYIYSDSPKFILLDFCNSCQAELNTFITDWVKKAEA